MKFYMQDWNVATAKVRWRKTGFLLLKPSNIFLDSLIPELPNEPRDLYWTLGPLCGGGRSVKTGGMTLLTKVAFLLSGLQNLADISTWPSEWHVLRSFCRAGDRRWEKRNRWTTSPGKHRRAVYFYSIFFERIKDTLMTGISLIQSDVDSSWSLM